MTGTPRRSRTQGSDASRARTEFSLSLATTSKSLSSNELAGFAHTRANVWRYEPGTPLQTANHGDEDLVYASGTPPEREHAEILDPAL